MTVPTHILFDVQSTSRVNNKARLAWLTHATETIHSSHKSVSETAVKGEFIAYLESTFHGLAPAKSLTENFR